MQALIEKLTVIQQRESAGECGLDHLDLLVALREEVERFVGAAGMARFSGEALTAEEIRVTEIALPNGEHIEQAVFREKASGLFFSVDASYVEQEVGPVLSPYGHGVVTGRGADESDDH